MAFPTEVEHLSVEEVSAYLDGALLDADRERIQAHLADCPECREEVVELSRLIRTSRTRPMLRWMATVGVAASLALIVSRVSFLGPNTATPNPSHSIERGPSAAETGKLSILQPPRAASVRRDSLILIWVPAVSASAHYRVTLSDAQGRVLWTASTPDTMLRIPSSVLLPLGKTYYWYVDALLSDGQTRTTGVQEFRMLP